MTTKSVEIKCITDKNITADLYIDDQNVPTLTVGGKCDGYNLDMDVDSMVVMRNWLNVQIGLRTKPQPTDEPDVHNFVIESGGLTYGCETTTQVWEIVGRFRFGQPWSVSSPKGFDVTEFICF